MSKTKQIYPQYNILRRKLFKTYKNPSTIPASPDYLCLPQPPFYLVSYLSLASRLWKLTPLSPISQAFDKKELWQKSFKTMAELEGNTRKFLDEFQRRNRNPLGGSTYTPESTLHSVAQVIFLM